MAVSALSVTWGSLGLTQVRIGTALAPTDDTGVTVVLCPPGTVGAVDVAGGAPATRETDLLRPENRVAGPDAICLCGGSAPGLAAADGVLRALAAQGRGFPAGGVRVPIVPAAAVFDAGARVAHAPGVAEGEAALVAAATALGGVAPEGPVGAGRSVSVGKIFGPVQETPSGQAAGTLTLPELGVVGVLVVVNAFGSVRARDGRVLAGPREGHERPQSVTRLWLRGHAEPPPPGGATTLAVVATDVPLDKARLRRVARMAHDGLARAIDPLHTPYDGDTVFAVFVPGGTTQPNAKLPEHADDAAGRVGAAGALLLEEAVRRAVRLGGGPVGGRASRARAARS